MRFRVGEWVGKRKRWGGWRGIGFDEERILWAYRGGEGDRAGLLVDGGRVL